MLLHSNRIAAQLNICWRIDERRLSVLPRTSRWKRAHSLVFLANLTKCQKMNESVPANCLVRVVRRNQYDTEDEALDQRVTREPRAVPRHVHKPMLVRGCSSRSDVTLRNPSQCWGSTRRNSLSVIHHKTMKHQATWSSWCPELIGDFMEFLLAIDQNDQARK